MGGLPFGIWPRWPLQVAQTAGRLAAVVDYYVRTPAAGGSDGGNGSVERPWATPQRAVDAIQQQQQPARVHMGSGTYTRPLLSNLKLPVLFVGDGGGDPADDGLIQVVAPTAAGVGTTGDAIVGAFVNAAQRFNTIEFVTGAAAGQRRTVLDNDATSLVPYSTFSDPPVAGDIYRIVTPGVVWQGFEAGETWIQGCGAIATGYATQSQPSVATLPDRLFLVNVALSAGASVKRVHILDSSVWFAGVDAGPNWRFSSANSILSSGANQLGGNESLELLLGLAPAQYRGYGFGPRSTQTPNIIGQAVFEGFVAWDALVNLGSRSSLVLLGCDLRRGASLSDYAGLNLSRFFAARTRLLSPNAAPALTVQGGAVATVNTNVIITGASGDAVRCLTGGMLRIAGTCTVTTTTGNAVNCSQGGRCYLTSDPTGGTWTGGSAGFRVSATEAQAAAFFSAVDTTLVAAIGNGSIVTRTA